MKTFFLLVTATALTASSPEVSAAPDGHAEFVYEMWNSDYMAEPSEEEIEHALSLSDALPGDRKSVV